MLAGLGVLNAWSQPYEDAIGLVPPTRPYFIDPIWYLDDILGPSLFMLAGLHLLRHTPWRRCCWPVLGLGMSCLAFSLGDTVDIHWVLPTGTEASNDSVSYSSWISKVMVVIVFCFFIVHAYDQLDRRARKAAVFAFLLLYIDQIQISISFDFAGYAFHVFEESLEVVTGLFFVRGVALLPIRPADQSSG